MPIADSVMLFRDLKDNLGKDFSSLPVRRLALLGDSATQFLAKAVRGHGYEEKLNFEIFEADYDQLDRQILDSGSELYRSSPEHIVLYPAVEKLWTRFAGTTPGDRNNFATHILAEVENWWTTIACNCKATVIQLNYVEINDAVFGHFAAKVKSSFSHQIKTLNLGLMNLAQQYKHVFIADLAGLSSHIGYANAHDPRLYAASKVAMALDFLPAVATAVVDIIKAINGNIKKCLVLDLDNTVWGGVIGDDGIENIEVGELGMGAAFDGLQLWAKQLKQRGIVLAVCSKNDEETAKQPFREHPDMILRLDDIAIFVANWENKVDNIRRIQATLNIGLDSMVLLDDNPFERNLVRERLPAVTVPELPDDPTLYVSYLRSLNLFETASFCKEDMERTRLYQVEVARTEFQKAFTSIDDYLTNLEMVSAVTSLDDFSIPRVAQLTQRSNQFNLRTIRYTDADIARMRRSGEFIPLCFHLEDKVGDHGLIGLIILQKVDHAKAFVDTWIMSCRVLKRGMEEFMVNQAVQRARQSGVQSLVGEYVPTSKNQMVKDLYCRMGFTHADGQWELNLQQFQELKTFIRLKTHGGKQRARDDRDQSNRLQPVRQ